MACHRKKESTPLTKLRARKAGGVDFFLFFFGGGGPLMTSSFHDQQGQAGQWRL